MASQLEGSRNVNNLVKAALACAAVLGLAGCGNGVESGTGGPELHGSSAKPAAPAVQVNERGFIAKQLGETACFGGDANCAGGVTFAIDKIEVDPPCGEFGSHPENGHTLLIHIRVATGTDEEAIDRVGGIINPFSFVEIGKDGVTRPTSYSFCADSSTNQLPDSYGPNQQYAGVIDLEVPDGSGIIALQRMVADEDGQRGWEWAYPV
jgi:hypothetical protein